MSHLSFLPWGWFPGPEIAGCLPAGTANSFMPQLVVKNVSNSSFEPKPKIYQEQGFKRSSVHLLLTCRAPLRD